MEKQIDPERDKVLLEALDAIDKFTEALVDIKDLYRRFCESGDTDTGFLVSPILHLTEMLANWCNNGDIEIKGIAPDLYAKLEKEMNKQGMWRVNDHLWSSVKPN